MTGLVKSDILSVPVPTQILFSTFLDYGLQTLSIKSKHFI